MSKREQWCLATLVFALLLVLPGLAVAEDSAAAGGAAGRPALVPGDPGAESPSAPVVVDMAAAVIPNANHYKCYPILSSTVFNPQRVLLRDQFWNTWVWVLRPRYLCNPVWKTTQSGVTYAPPQPDAHLVCYDIREDIPTTDWEVRTTDQFGTLGLKGNAAELLCLPAAKTVIVPPT